MKHRDVTKNPQATVKALVSGRRMGTGIVNLMGNGIPLRPLLIVLSLLMVRTAVSFGQVVSPPPAQISEATAIVTDPAGAVIANAEVTFKGPETVTRRTASDGSVHLRLPYGHYDVTIASPGFVTTKIIGLPVDTGKAATLNVVLRIDPIIHDDYFGEEALVPTISSELPNVISERLPVQSTVFIGDWRPTRWKTNRRRLGIVFVIWQSDAGLVGKVHFYNPRSEHETAMLNPKVNGETLAFEVDDNYVRRKIDFSMTVQKGGKSAVVTGRGGEMIFDFEVTKQH
jgi:hypothetical protein